MLLPMSVSFHAYLLTYSMEQSQLVLTYLLPSFFTYSLTFFHSFFLSYLLPFLLTYFLTYLLPYFLTSLLPFFLSYLLTFLLIYFLTSLLPSLLTYSLHAAESLRSQPVLSQSRNSPHFMESEGSLPHSQVPAICPYPEPVRSNPYPHILLPEDPS